MATRDDSITSASAPLVVERRFAVPKQIVFAAWGSAEHLKRWFCPADYSVPEAEVEFRVGGAFNICMRSPQGHEHWTRGRYVEIVPNNRLVIEMDISAEREAQAPALFRAHTTVSLADEEGATRLTVTQRYTPLHPAAAAMIQGAEQGWSQTLDRLEQELTRMSQSAEPSRVGGARAEPVSRSVVHASFRIERIYEAAPAQVYQAFIDPSRKAQWFSGGEGFTLLARSMDVRQGGRERLQGRWERGTHRGSADQDAGATSVVTTFDALYLDVVPNERLVYAYEMHLDERKISVSLATVELNDAGRGTRLVVTEQGAFLDGYDDAGSRERGTAQLLDGLGRSLQRSA